MELNKALHINCTKIHNFSVVLGQNMMQKNHCYVKPLALGHPERISEHSCGIHAMKN